MNKNLIDKTNSLIRNQNTINVLLQELRDEVVLVDKENMSLKHENMTLKEELKTMKFDSLLKEEEVRITDVLVESDPNPILLKEELHVNDIPDSPTVYQEDIRVYKDNSIKKSNVYEFFLGKNIIAKLAAIMISLGIYTFARMAYIRWMGDYGRFFFIMLVGIVFFMVGHLFDKKQSKLFSSIFYSIGLVTGVISLFLGGFTLELLSNSLFIIMNLIMTALVFVYFMKRREWMMDFVLLIVYLTLLIFTSIISSYDASVFITISYIISMILVFSIVGTYILNFYKDNKSKFLLPYLSFMMIATLFQFLVMGKELLPIIIWSVGLLALTYLINFNWMNKVGRYNSFIGGQTITTILISILVSYSEIYDKSIQFDSLQFLLLFVLFVPIYIYLYKDKGDNKAHTVDVYAVIMTISLIFYASLFGKAGSPYHLKEELIYKNMIFLIIILLVYMVSRFSNRKTHYWMFLLIIGAFVLHITNSIIIIRSIDFSYSLLFIPNLLLFVGLLLLDRYIGNMTNKPKVYLSYTLQSGLLLVLPMAFLMISNSLKASVSPRYDFIYWSSLVYYLVLYKHLFTSKFFIKDDKLIYKNIINIIIIGIITMINFMYFDHDFSTALDVITFSIVLLPNLYILYCIKEVYEYAKRETNYDAEWLFIILYKLGVVVQSLFITYYINFTYDKILLSSYFMIVAAIGVLYGFKAQWKRVRYIGLGAIYFSFIKFFVYDFLSQDLSDTVKTVTYITLGVVLMGIAFLYSRLEKTYGGNEIV